MAVRNGYTAIPDIHGSGTIGNENSLRAIDLEDEYIQDNNRANRGVQSFEIESER